MSIRAGLEAYYDTLGIRGVLAIASHRVTSWPKELTVRSDAAKYPMRVRVHTSDLSVYRSIMLAGEYKLEFPDFEPRTIIDAGANCGMASVYYANAYPNAQIVAVEPDRSNFEMLVKNTRKYKNVTCFHAALWHKDGEVNLSGGTSFDKWAVQTVEGSGVRALTVETLMRINGFQSIDLFKIDIEGAEKELFQGAPWMSKVKVLCIELHDRMIPGCREPVEKSCTGFKSWEKGELTYFVNKRLVGEYALSARQRA